VIGIRNSEAERPARGCAIKKKGITAAADTAAQKKRMSARARASPRARALPVLCPEDGLESGL